MNLKIFGLQFQERLTKLILIQSKIWTISSLNGAVVKIGTKMINYKVLGLELRKLRLAKNDEVFFILSIMFVLMHENCLF